MEVEVGSAGGPWSRRVVAAMERAELEDKHLGLMDENHLLKKHARSQEEKMKKMATKLLKLAADEKREARKDGLPPSVAHVKELEEEVQDLISKVRDLEKTNTSLQNKVTVLRQQCDSKWKRRTPYDHVQSRISSGLTRRGHLRGNVSSNSSPTPPRYGRSLLDDARRDNQELEELVLRLKQEVSVLTAQGVKYQEQMKLQATEHEQERLSLQQQLQAESAAKQQQGIEEDVEVIRLQRELREKSDHLLTLQAQHSALEKNLEAMRSNHSKLLQEIELLNSKLKEEQTHSVELQGQLHSNTVLNRAVVELQEMVDDLRAEKDILKKANDKLMKSAAVVEDRGSEYRGQVRALQERVRELENAQQAHVTATSHTTQKLSSDREVREQLEQEVRETREAYHHLQAQHQQLQIRLQSEVREGSSEPREQVKDAAVNTDPTPVAPPVTSDPLGLPQKVDDKSDLHEELSELRSSHADIVAELEKTRQLLATQRTINQDYKKEVDVLKEQMSQLQSHHSTQIAEQKKCLAGKVTLHSSPEHPSHTHNQQAGTHTVAADADTQDSGSNGGHDNTEGSKGVWEGQEKGKMGSEEKQEQKKLSKNKRERKEMRRGAGIDHELVTDPEASGVKPQLPTQPKKLTNDTPPITAQPHPRETSRLGKTATEKLESGQGLPAHHLPPLRTGAGMALPPDQVECKAGLKHESREEQMVRKETHDLNKMQEKDEADEEESIEEEDISSSHSSSEVGTPSTSTPLKAVPPHSSSGSTSGGPEPSLPPPLSSSLSAIVEPHSSITEPKTKTRENGGREARGVGGGGFVMMGGGEEGVGSSEDGDSVSVTVTEMSDEGDEDTMFEETLPQYTTESNMSGRTIATPSQPSVKLVSDDEEDSPLISSSLTSGDEENPITPTAPQPQHVQTAAQDTLSITIVSFTIEPGSSLTTREDISGYFVEFQLLDYDYGELETPSAFTSPHSTQPVLFNFKTDFHVGPSQKALLSSALSHTADTSDAKVIFTVVSDPVDQEGDCDEVGTAEVDLSTILQRRKDVINEHIEVLSSDEDSELLGHLTVSVYALDVLQHLS